ncbi:hypothetical protein MAR_006973 [Mya arenaria]|uniref:Uncharacterized protein n=1 Tax=Mya arenaria TaxID=6604 RepID=A0ABY7DCL6_MYAAR|nr:hypothetical protein MAR_006973 [Mya arenaria]
MAFVSKLQCLKHRQHPQQMLRQQERILWYPQSLPPISAAAKYHSPRVSYQVQQWMKPLMILCHKTGDRKRVMGYFVLSKLTYHQLHRNTCRSPDPAARLIAAVRLDGIELDLLGDVPLERPETNKSDSRPCTLCSTVTRERPPCLFHY